MVKWYTHSFWLHGALALMVFISVNVQARYTQYSPYIILCQKQEASINKLYGNVKAVVALSLVTICIDAPMIRNSANKNNRFTSIVNHANRRTMMCLPTEARKRKRIVACDACLYCQNVHVTSHRAYRHQCPQRSNPNHIKNLAQAVETKKKFDVVSQSALTQT